MKLYFAAASLAFALATGCSSTSMSGGGSARPEKTGSTSVAASTNTSADGTASTDKLGNTSTAVQTDTNSEIPDASTSTETPPTPSPQPSVPSEVIDGMEVLTSCDRCLARAKQLSQTIGFEATKAKAYNLGYHKIDPARGLCDIHFTRNDFDRIAEHEGRDSVLDNQVAVYCPCDCGWKNAG